MGKKIRTVGNNTVNSSDRIEDDVCDLPSSYHDVKGNKFNNIFRLITVILLVFIIIIGIFGFIFLYSEKDSSDPYNKIYKSTYTSYGETLDMYLIVSEKKCTYAVGSVNNYTNNCYVIKSADGNYSLKLENEKYNYSNGDFECINCSNKTVFKYYKKIDS